MLKILFPVLFFLLISNVTFGIRAAVVNEEFKNVPLKEVIQVLKRNYRLKVAFSDKNVRDVLVNVNIQNLSIEEAFVKILENTNLSFELIDENTIIIKKQKKEQNEPLALSEFSGVISDALTGESLPYAAVWNEENQTNFLSNEEGYFFISDTRKFNKIRVSYLGYQDTILELSKQSRHKRLQIGLKAKVTELEEYILADQEIDNFITVGQAGKITYNPINARQTPSVGEVDVLRSLQLLPGVNATNEISSGLNINGGTNNQNLFLFDGFTVYHVDHFFGYFSAFNPYAIQSLRLYKGGFEAKYGGRASSVVDISGKDGNRNETKGSLGFNLLSVNTSLEVPLSDKGATLFFSGRRSYTDVWSSSLFENIFSIFETSITEGPRNILFPRTVKSEVKPDFYYSDINFKISSRVGAKNQISFSFYDSNDLLNYTEKSQVNFRDTLSVSTKKLGVINWGNVGTSLNFSRQWNSNNYTSAHISYSFYESTFQEIATSDVKSSSQGNFQSVESQDQLNNIEDFSIKLDHEWTLGNSNTIETGISGSLYNNQLKYVANDSLLVDKSELNEYLLAHYLQGTFALSPRLSVSPGLRSSYFSTTGNIYFEPRFSFIHKLNETLQLKGATGIYNQFINQSNTKNVLEGSRDFWILANGRNVPVQKAWHGLLGIEYAVNKNLFTLGIFQKNFNGLMEYAFRNGSLITQFEDQNRVFTSGDGVAKGVEMMVKRDLGNFSSWVTYTLSQVKYTFPRINQGRSFFADHDQRHEINWFGVYAFKKFEFSATWIFGSGKPFSSYEGVVTRPSNSQVGPPIIQIQIPERNGERLPAYHRLDVSARYFLNLGKSRANVSLGIFNLYNRENILDTKVSVIAPRDRKNNRDQIIGTTYVPLMGITPNFSFEINF